MTETAPPSPPTSTEELWRLYCHYRAKERDLARRSRRPPWVWRFFVEDAIDAGPAIYPALVDIAQNPRPIVGQPDWPPDTADWGLVLMAIGQIDLHHGSNCYARLLVDSAIPPDIHEAACGAALSVAAFALIDGLVRIASDQAQTGQVRQAAEAAIEELLDRMEANQWAVDADVLERQARRSFGLFPVRPSLPPGQNRGLRVPDLLERWDRMTVAGLLRLRGRRQEPWIARELDDFLLAIINDQSTADDHRQWARDHLRRLGHHSDEW